MTSLERSFVPRRNSLNVLRLAMAGMVIVSHAWPLRGESSPEPEFGDSTLGRWAVAGFFIVSGFLITRSRVRRSTWQYTKDRLLRIFPAFLVVTVVIAFLLAPASLLFTSGREWSAPSAIGYIFTNLPLGGGFPFRQDSVGTTLEGMPAEVWNGATWTLIFEAVCYVGIAVAVSIIPRKALGPTLFAGWIAMAGMAQTSVWVESAPKIVYDTGHMMGAFCIGALFWLYRGHIPVGRIAVSVALVVLVLLCLAGLGRSLALVPFGIIIFYLSWAIPVDQIGSHDFSYGLYVWGWPTQQFLLVAGGASLDLWLNILIVTLCASGLGWLSAVFVEKPTLRLKGRTSSQDFGEQKELGHRAFR